MLPVFGIVLNSVAVCTRVVREEVVSVFKGCSMSSLIIVCCCNSDGVNLLSCSALYTGQIFPDDYELLQKRF